MMTPEEELEKLRLEYKRRKPTLDATDVRIFTYRAEMLKWAIKGKEEREQKIHGASTLPREVE